MKYWLTLVTSLPSENATARQRVWRALKTTGAAVLRDGVYLMPMEAHHQATLQAIAADAMESGGSALVMRIEQPEGEDFSSRFSRAGDYAELNEAIIKLHRDLSLDKAQESLRQVRKLRKAYVGLTEIDYFPDAWQRQTDVALVQLETSITLLLAPDEPHAVDQPIQVLAKANFQNRSWATRKRPWVDRLACAWLIQRFIDPGARLVWLSNAARCPASALGFDFDGATFTHTNGLVTFEVLMQSFSLRSPALLRVAQVVHHLDVGGIQPREASGVERILKGLAKVHTDDDELLNSSNTVFDGLHAAFSAEDEAA